MSERPDYPVEAEQEQPVIRDKRRIDPLTGQVRDSGLSDTVRDRGLSDNRDSVSLTWAYPNGSEGPVLISGGRRGEPQRAFQQLPAGSADYVVYGLNEQLDYCFTVSVVHSTERVAASTPVCTARR